MDGYSHLDLVQGRRIKGGATTPGRFYGWSATHYFLRFLFSNMNWKKKM